MYKEKIVIEVKNNINRFLDKCIKNKIELLNVTYIDEKNILITIYLNDLDRLKKYNYYSEINVFKRLGLSKIVLFFKRNLLFFIVIFFCFFIMSILENIIVEVRVIHSNKEIIELVSDEVKKHGIKELSLAKDFKELENIRDQIINDNPKVLEWMSIKRVGMKYIIHVEERILTDIKKENKVCHVVATKDGIVKSIKAINGESIVLKNDYVRRGDILISGEIHLYEEVKDNVCANGIVMGEVWYKVNLSFPYNYIEKEYTGNKKYNFIFNKKKLFKEKYQNFDKEMIYDFNFLGFNFKYYKELEYVLKDKKYTKDEVLEKALQQVDEKVKMKLKNNGEIISKKILKKDEFNSRIDIEVFVVTLENISKSQEYEIVSDESDIE